MPAVKERAPRELVLADETIIVRVRESGRARRLRVVVGPGRPPEAVVPRGVSDRELDRFLREHRAWIGRTVAASRAIASTLPQLHQPGVVWLGLRAVPVSVVVTTAPGAPRTTARLQGGRLVVGEVARSGAGDAGIRAVERWYRREARRRIGEAVERESARLGLSPGTIGIRDQRTRWGSCSRAGHLSFNWRLVIAPAEVLEYVVVHELCHLREHNHSSAFWRLVTASRPGWRDEAGWLRAHGQELHDYDPAKAVEH